MQRKSVVVHVTEEEGVESPLVILNFGKTLLKYRTVEEQKELLKKMVKENSRTNQGFCCDLLQRAL